jgi:hypothetical protein
MDEIIENRKNYKPAVRTKHRFANLTILMHGTWIFIKSLIQYLPVAIKKLCKFGLKNIEGQLALGKFFFFLALQNCNYLKFQ